VEQEFAVGREPLFREDLIPEVEKWLLLEAITRKRIVKTLRDGKVLADALVICKVLKLVMAL
jgi:hypothetical protein